MSLSPSLRVPSSRAPVHILGLQGTSVVIVDDQETARLARAARSRLDHYGLSDAGNDRGTVHQGATQEQAASARSGDGGYGGRRSSGTLRGAGSGRGGLSRQADRSA